MRRVSLFVCWTQGIPALPNAASNDGSSFVPGLPAWSLFARLRSGEAAPSLFSSPLRSDEPGGLPPAAAEVAQASRSDFRRTIIAGNRYHLPPAGCGVGAAHRHNKSLFLVGKARPTLCFRIGVKREEEAGGIQGSEHGGQVQPEGD